MRGTRLVRSDMRANDKVEIPHVIDVAVREETRATGKNWHQDLPLGHLDNAIFRVVHGGRFGLWLLLGATKNAHVDSLVRLKAVKKWKLAASVPHENSRFSRREGASAIL